MANIMTESEIQTRASAWKLQLKSGLIYNILSYLKSVIDQVYTDLAGSGSIELSALFEAPLAATTASVLAATTLTAEVQSITEGITQPDMPRALVLTPTMAGETLAGDVVVHGTDIEDNVISETFALANGASVTGAKAFKTITSIDLPVLTTEADAVAFGLTAKLGFPALLTEDTIYISLVDGVQETHPTVVVHATDIAQVLCTPNTAPNGSRDFKFFYHI